MTQLLFIPSFLGNFRGWEWLVIFLVILLLFGGKKIPELMRGLGKGVHSFRKGMQEAKDQMNRPLEDTPASKKEDTTPEAEKLGKDRS